MLLTAALLGAFLVSAASSSSSEDHHGLQQLPLQQQEPPDNLKFHDFKVPDAGDPGQSDEQTTAEGRLV